MQSVTAARPLSSARCGGRTALRERGDRTHVRDSNDTHETCNSKSSKLNVDLTHQDIEPLEFEPINDNNHNNTILNDYNQNHNHSNYHNYNQINNGQRKRLHWTTKEEEQLKFGLQKDLFLIQMK